MYTFGSAVHVPFIMEIAFDPFLFLRFLANFPEEDETTLP